MEANGKRMQTLGRQMRTARRAADVTQSEAAEMIGVTKQTVSNWETGKNEPSFLQMERLCRVVYGITSAELRGI